jgi:hypothetical protein
MAAIAGIIVADVIASTAISVAAQRRIECPRTTQGNGFCTRKSPRGWHHAQGSHSVPHGSGEAMVAITRQAIECYLKNMSGFGITVGITVMVHLIGFA